MKSGAMITLGVILQSCAWAATGAEVNTVIVCFEGASQPRQVEAGLVLASQIFKSAGVILDWYGAHTSCRGARDRVIIVGFSTNTPKTFRPRALAYSLPYEGVHILVFYDRILRSDPDLVPALLAYVIVHEVTHVLQGVDHHSAKGIMKAYWDTSDFPRMKRAQMNFADSDIAMIHDGLAARERRRMPRVMAPAAWYKVGAQSISDGGFGTFSIARVGY